MPACAIDLDRLSSAYGTTRVCDEISLRIRRGAKVVLVGSNGAGKSSLLNILAGKRRPVGGSALVLGEDAFECTTLVQRIALVTSEWMECVPGTNLPVKTLVASAAVGVAPERVAELVEVLGAHALLRSHVNSLSEGQRRCVHLLCKLLPPRELLLFDEATSSLDVVRRGRLLRWLARESGERGVTVVFCTHVFDGLDGWADDLVQLSRGRLARHVPTAELPAGTSIYALVCGWLCAAEAAEAAEGGKSGGGAVGVLAELADATLEEASRREQAA